MNPLLNDIDISQVAIEEFCINEVFKTPKVSIIIPAYNTEKYIGRCLLSMVRQTLKEIEIIIINDGSTDNTSAVIEKFSQLDSRIKVINQENKKQGAARNRGMEIAIGEFIGFVDSDDWVDLDYFEKLYNAATKNAVDVALATNVRVGLKKTKKRLNITKEKVFTNLQDKFDACRQYKNECPTNKIYKRAMLTKNNITWPEGCYCEDKLFTAKAVYYANGLATVPGINYYYYRNPTSTVNTKSKEHSARLNEDKNNARLAVIKFLKENNADIRDKEFWAVKKVVRFLGLPLLVIKESLHTENFYLFSFIKIGERTYE